jgi:hypothetical protein
LVKIIEFFKTGISPINEKETLAIFAFMEAADASKKSDGARIKLTQINE